MIRFEWDSKKAISNAGKHGVTFEEAKTVFYDDQALQFYDVQHSSDEDRFLLLGLSTHLRLLIVCHCVREDEQVVRILSARKATKSESKYYYR